MYPVLIQHLADLRAGDRLIAHSGVRYPRPLQVIAELHELPGRAGRGVLVESQDPDGPAQLTMWPWQMDGQVLEIDRPSGWALGGHRQVQR